MAANLKPVEQLGMDERDEDNPALEAKLTAWSELRDTASLARAAANRAKASLMDELDALDIGIGAAVRIGKWRIARTMRAGRDVEFHTDAKEALSIKLIED
jgi:hypothetical protein